MRELTGTQLERPTLNLNLKITREGEIMKKLLIAIVTSVSAVAFAQDTEAAIARFTELGVTHNNAPIDADNIVNIQSLRIDVGAAELFTDSDVRHLLAIPRLGNLAFSAAPNLTAASLAQLEGIENLWKLEFRNAGLRDEQVQGLAGLHSLRSLDLTQNDQVTDAAMEAIAGLRSLETLTLNSTAVTDAGISSLAGHSSLQRVSLLRTAVTDAALESLGQISGLRSLSLSSTHISGSGFAHLGGLEALEEIDAQHLQLTDSSIELLADIPSLQRLYLWDNSLTDAATSSLASLPALRTLYLDNNSISDLGLRAFDGHGSLRILWLSGTDVTDAGLSALTGVALEQVFLNGTAVTDDGLLLLAGIPSLSSIQVRRTAVSEAGVEAALELEGRHERLRIHR